jgi:hypothetical protein
MDDVQMKAGNLMSKEEADGESASNIVVTLAAVLTMWAAIAGFAFALWVANRSLVVSIAFFVIGSVAIGFATARKQRIIKGKPPKTG